MTEACHQVLGIAELPIFAVAAEHERRELMRVLPDYETVPLRGIYAVYPPNRYVSARVRLFFKSLVDFGRTLPWRGVKSRAVHPERTQRRNRPPDFPRFRPGFLLAKSRRLSGLRCGRRCGALRRGHA